MGLACAALVPRIKKSEKSLRAVILGFPSFAPFYYTGIGRFQVALFQNIGLLLPVFRREDEMVLDNGKLIQNKRVGWVLWRELSKKEIGGGVLKGVWFRTCSALVGFGGSGWFLCKRRTVTELKLGHQSISGKRRGRAGASTGMPDEWIMEKWVGENVRWPASLAAAKRLATKDDRLSERPNCIVMSK